MSECANFEIHTFLLYRHEQDTIGRGCSSKANLTQKDTKAVLDAFYATVAEQAAKSEPIVITGFGSFSVSERAAKEGRNPATGEKMTIPAKKVVKFKPGKDLAL